MYLFRAILLKPAYESPIDSANQILEAKKVPELF